eukprot:CCRYP_008240-RA/>CCRYP_008240-RA protein AED:0.04 eAED:0.04 QI:215/1/1/1/0.5/0.33/3/1633/491
MSQQPRGLPGFLRRTLRNDVLDAPSASVEPGLGVVGAGMSNVSASGVASSSDPSDAAGITSGSPETPNASLGGSWTSESSGSGCKQLRTVAFPPLPRERGGEESSDDSIDNNENDGRGITQKTTKTLATPSKNSTHSSTSSTTQQQTQNNNNNNQQAQPRSYKETQFETIISSSIISLRDLRKISWNGIPPHHRSLTWKILLGYLPANTSRHASTLHRKRAEYKDARKQHYDIPDDSRTNSEQETLRQVLVDVPRTAPEVPLFHNDRIRRCLTRLLYIWAMRHPASSYVQGINDLATPFIAVFLAGYYNGVSCLDGEVMASVTDEMMEEVEADTYWCLTNLLAGIQDHYTSDQPGMQRMVMRLEELVNRIDVDLSSHLKETGIEFMQFAFKWMNCLLLREFSLSCVIRLWDTYLSEESGGFEDFHVYVCASFLVHFSNELQQMGFDELFQFMQNMPTQNWGDREIEILLSSAFVLSTLFGGSEAHLNVVRA